MSIRIDKNFCNGCRGAQEPMCVRICPGNLLSIGDDGRAVMRDNRDCWDCAACVKACPRQAIQMYLPVQIGGNGATLQAKATRDKIIWTCTKPDGGEEIFVVEAETII